MKTKIKEVDIKGDIKYIPQVKFGLFESTKYKKMKWLNLVDVDNHKFECSCSYSKFFQTIDEARNFLEVYILSNQK